MATKLKAFDVYKIRCMQYGFEEYNTKDRYWSEVYIAHNEEEAIEKFRKKHPDHLNTVFVSMRYVGRLVDGI